LEKQLLEGDCFPCVDAERCSNMGYYADRSAGRGVMYLATREEEPFCGTYQSFILKIRLILKTLICSSENSKSVPCSAPERGHITAHFHAG